MKRVLIALSMLAMLASCSSYSTVGPGEVQIAGHKYKTVEDCARKAPVGEFDEKCDVPVVGWHGAQGMDAIIPSAGNFGGGMSVQ